MPSVQLPLSGDVTQAFNPMNWANSGQLSFFNVNLGSSADPALERSVIDEVGSYGRQIGRLGDVLAILLKHADRSKFSELECTALADFEAQWRAVEAIKKRKQAR
jgi:hypothetical protein